MFGLAVGDMMFRLHQVALKVVNFFCAVMMSSLYKPDSSKKEHPVYFILLLKLLEISSGFCLFINVLCYKTCGKSSTHTDIAPVWIYTAVYQHLLQIMYHKYVPLCAESFLHTGDFQFRVAQCGQQAV